MGQSSLVEAGFHHGCQGNLATDLQISGTGTVGIHSVLWIVVIYKCPKCVISSRHSLGICCNYPKCVGFS